MDTSKNIIYAVDFDGTLSLGRWPDVGEPNTPLIEWLKREKTGGARLILWTNRAGAELEEAIDYCSGYGLTFDAVNDNLPEITELYQNNSRKVSADIYIDDKSVNPCPENVIDAIRYIQDIRKELE